MDRPFSVGSYVVLIMAAITEVTQEDYKFLASLSYKAKPPPPASCGGVHLQSST